MSDAVVAQNRHGNETVSSVSPSQSVAICQKLLQLGVPLFSAVVTHLQCGFVLVTSAVLPVCFPAAVGRKTYHYLHGARLISTVGVSHNRRSQNRLQSLPPALDASSTTHRPETGSSRACHARRLRRRRRVWHVLSNSTLPSWPMCPKHRYGRKLHCRVLAEGNTRQ